MPLVGSEVEQLRAALRSSSTELAAAVLAMRDLHFQSTGTPSCDPAVADAMRHIGSALSGLGATADECLQVINRHPELAAESSLTTDSEPRPQLTDPSAGS